MITPTFQFLKQKGTTTYTFPSGSEDESILRSNPDYGMAFTHVVLLKLPKYVNNKKMDFESAFVQSNASIEPSTFSDALIESLRNYVANHDTVLRTSKINDTQYYYNIDELTTPTEKIFWKWLKKLNALSLEPALSDEYNLNLSDFNSNGTNSQTDYFRKYLWKERNIENITISSITNITLSPTVANSKRILFNKSTNYRIGDTIKIYNVTGLTSVTVIKILTVNTTNDAIAFADAGSYTINTNPYGVLDYERVIKGIAEVNADSSEIRPDGSHHRLYSLVPYEFGLTPYVLFSTEADENYKPGSTYPIRSSEMQQEIKGAERSDSVFFTNPNNYPGDWFGQFDDTITYKTASGDSLKRSGNYYGLTVNSNIGLDLIFPTFDGRLVDGLTIDFNIKHYSYAQNTVPICNNFTEFSSAIIGGVPPQDFDFNAILWYYDVIDESTNLTIKKKNLYCIQFLDNPNNDVNSTFVPSYDKLVNDGVKDGTSYNLSLITETVSSATEFTPKFDPTRGHDVLNYDLFSQAIKRLADLNQVYLGLITTVGKLQTELNSIENLLGTMPSYETLYNKMDNMEALLNAYKTLNIGSSSTIESVLDTSVSPPVVKLNSIDKNYGDIVKIDTKLLYNLSGPSNNRIVTAIPYTLNITTPKDFLTIINNNDSYTTDTFSTSYAIPQLQINLEKDLNYKQKIDLLILSDSNSFYNKKLDFNVNFNYNGVVTPINIIAGLNLPVNQVSDTVNDYSLNSDNNFGFNPKNIYYRKDGSNRYIGIETDLDPRFIPLNSKLFLKDLKFKVNNLFYDASGIYPLSSYTVNKGSLKDIKLVETGSGYLSTAERYIWFGTSINNASKNTRIKLKPSGGIINNVLLDYNASNNYLPFNESLSNVFILDSATQTDPLVSLGTTSGTSTYYDNINNLLILSLQNQSGGSNKTKLRLYFKNTYTMEFKIPSDSDIVSVLDTIVTGYTNEPYYINTYNPSDNSIKLNSNPIILPFKGYKIQIIRISDIDNVLPTEWQKRYKILTEIL